GERLRRLPVAAVPSGSCQRDVLVQRQRAAPVPRDAEGRGGPERHSRTGAVRHLAERVPAIPLRMGPGGMTRNALWLCGAIAALACVEASAQTPDTRAGAPNGDAAE